MRKAPVLRGSVLLQGCSEQLSLKQLQQGILEIRQRMGLAGIWAKSTQKNVHFFLWMREYLFCIEWWGGPGGKFELQAILSRVAFLQTTCVRISESPPHPHMSPRLLPCSPH